MTPALRQTLCDHAAGNYRILTANSPGSTRSSTSKSSRSPRRQRLVERPHAGDRHRHAQGA